MVKTDSMPYTEPRRMYDTGGWQGQRCVFFPKIDYRKWMNPDFYGKTEYINLSRFISHQLLNHFWPELIHQSCLLPNCLLNLCLPKLFLRGLRINQKPNWDFCVLSPPSTNSTGTTLSILGVRCSSGHVIWDIKIKNRKTMFLSLTDSM